MKRTTSFLIATILAFTGCANENQMETTLRALERGKATGNLILTSDGRVSVDQQITFGFGASRSSLSFSGNIDFSNKLNRPAADAPEAKEAGAEAKSAPAQ